MQEATEEYRGYRIVVTPMKDCEDLWDFEYRLACIGGGDATRSRSKSAGGYATADIACFAGVEVARTEIDNLLALQEAAQQ